ncbi:MAG: dioxygenase, partial [Candidatus Eremiobacteraeota bacterium]|nr:dioxygenase [Candidatus Eremiobacteraeota bacterium]
GFPQALYDVEYPAPGDPRLARRVQELLAPTPVALADDWGLDHGVWSVPVHLFPEAGVPVVQLSLDQNEPPEFFASLGEKLRPLREDDVLLMASGNVVHNLRAFMMSMSGRGGSDDGWGVRFEEYVRARAASRDIDGLVHFEREGADARLSVPTIEHYLPILPIVASSSDSEPVSFPTAGIPAPGISMLSVRVG